MFKIAYIPGDGVGPEVLSEGRKVIDAACGKTGAGIEWVEFPVSGEHYLKTGETITDEMLEKIEMCDAIYFGAIGHPEVKPGILERGVLLKLRFYFDLYINLRPIKGFPGVPTPLKNAKAEDIDIMIIRETTEDTYVGIGGAVKGGSGAIEGEFKGHIPDFAAKIRCEAEKREKDDLCLQVGVMSRRGVERIMKYAYGMAEKRRKHIVCVTKSNVMQIYGFWDEIFDEIGKTYPSVKGEKQFVDAVTQWMVLRPESYDVMVAPNMFGDIITDLGSVLQGGMGMAPSALINPGKMAMFEPIHGSAPDIAGKGIANPVAAILSGAMMLRHLGEEKAAKLIEDAVSLALSEGAKTRDLGGTLSTRGMGDAIARKVEKLWEG